MAAIMTSAEATAAYQAALARKRGERRNVYRSYTEAERREAWIENRELERISVFAPEFKPAENLTEWLDDMVIAWGNLAGDPVQPLIITVLEAARGSVPAAVKALKLAQGLTPPHQFTVYTNLPLWRRQDDRGRAHGEQLALALLGEWDRLGLPTEDPALKPQTRRRRRAWENAEATA